MSAVVAAAAAPPASRIHLAYLQSWPLVGKLGMAPLFAIKKLDFDSERDQLFKTLNEAKKAIRLQMEVATSDNLLRLLTMGCRAIHYTGHGMESFLAFEDDEGKMHPMDPVQLRELLEAGRSSGGSTGIEFAFVSACHSQSAGNAFVLAGVPHVIAVRMDEAVCDKASQVFMKHFYLAILVGRTVRAAFDIAQKAVHNTPNLSGADEPRKFLLLPEGADHERTLFNDIPAGPWTDVSAPPVPHTIPAIPQNFLGRNPILQEVVARLLRKRLVTLTGLRGIGKTAVAIAAARYIWKRNHFDGVFLVDLRQLVRATQEWSDEHQLTNGGDTTDQTNGEPDLHGTRATHASLGRSRAPTLATLVSEACQLPETHRNWQHLFRALQSIPRLLLILDGADCLLSSSTPLEGLQTGEGETTSGPSAAHAASHDLREFVSSLLRHVAGSKVLITSCVPVRGIQDVSEEQLRIEPLSPLDAAQLFYDLRQRNLDPAEFGCNNLSLAKVKLSEHDALRLLAGHPRRIFHAVPLLLDAKMADLPPLIEAQIREEQAEAQQRHRMRSTRTPSRTDTPDSIHFGGHAHSGAAAASSAASDSSSPHAAFAHMFDHNLDLWFGGHGAARSRDLVAAGAQPLTLEEQTRWTSDTAGGAAFWRAAFGRVETTPWNEGVERCINHHFTQSIGSAERPLDVLDLRTMRAKMESLGSPAGYLRVQTFGAFWRDFQALCTTVRKILPYWLCASPARLVHAWCNRATCTDLLTEGPNPLTGAIAYRPPGTFVLRMSESQVGSIALGFVDSNNHIAHTLITTKGSVAHTPHARTWRVSTCQRRPFA